MFYNGDIALKISFKTTKLQKIFNSEKELKRVFGQQQAVKIMLRMGVLVAANNLNDISTNSPENRHELHGDRSGQFAVDLKQPYRLIFEPAHDPLPIKEDKGLDLEKITEIIILEVEDYH